MNRAIEWPIALIGFVVSLPVVLLCMAAVRLTSAGPAIFRQTRVGRNEAHFTCYKLRTMFVDTGDAPSHQVKSSAITPVGKFLRRTKLDELPQLWNIVLGDMSFVGPRPCLPTQFELIEARRRRGLYGLRPGITGISQVAGIDMSDPAKLAQSDARYLQLRSFATDVKIILQTVAGGGAGDTIK